MPLMSLSLDCKLSKMGKRKCGCQEDLSTFCHKKVLSANILNYHRLSAGCYQLKMSKGRYFLDLYSYGEEPED